MLLPTPLALPGCEETRGLLSGWLDDELDRTLRARVALHLAVCATCAREAAALAAVVAAMHALRRRRG